MAVKVNEQICMDGLQAHNEAKVCTIWYHIRKNRNISACKNVSTIWYTFFFKLHCDNVQNTKLK